MHKWWVIFKKEIFRVVTDRRLVLTVFVLPGLAIFLVYFMIGTVIGGQITSEETHEPTLYTEHMPAAIEERLEERVDYTLYEGDLERSELESMIEEETIDAGLIFEEDFLSHVESGAVPSVEVLYNPAATHSSNAFNHVNGALSAYHESIIIDRLDAPEDYHVYDLSTRELFDERAVTAQGFAMIMPMLIIIFLFVGVMNIGPDAIAGEKERGTMATLLVTPTRRRNIALGKVFSLVLLSFMSALSSFIGLLLSLPRLMQFDDSLPELSIYRFVDFLAIFVVIVSTVFFIVALVSVLSAFAKSVKEATTWIMPFYFIALIIGILNSFGASATQSFLPHLAPIYGPINILAGILTFEYSVLNLAAVLLSTLLYTGVFIAALNMMFNSEKVMFSK